MVLIGPMGRMKKSTISKKKQFFIIFPLQSYIGLPASSHLLLQMWQQGAS